MIDPSHEEKRALIEAASIFEEHGLRFAFPWECTLDDREHELYTALVLACRAYDKTMREGSPTRMLTDEEKAKLRLVLRGGEAE